MKNIKNYEFFTNLAYEFGFNVVGITPAQTTNLNQKGLDEFIQKKYHGSLTWIEEKKELRKSPKNLWPEAKSAIVFGFNYGPQNNPLLELNENSNAYVAVYARRKDYHKVLKGRLKQIASKIVSKLKAKVKVFVDTAPIMEKPLAHTAGIG